MKKHSSRMLSSSPTRNVEDGGSRNGYNCFKHKSLSSSFGPFSFSNLNSLQLPILQGLQKGCFYERIKNSHKNCIWLLLFTKVLNSKNWDLDTNVLKFRSENEPFIFAA